MPQSIQQVIVAEILQAIVHLLLVPVVLQQILIATLKRKRKSKKRRSLKKRRNKRATLQHQAPKPLVAQISQVARVRKSQSQVVVSQVKVHLHQAHNQSLAPIKKTTITTTTTTKIKKEAQPAQRVLVRVLVLARARARARAPARVRTTPKSLGRNLRRSTPRLQPSWVTIGASAWPRSMLRTAPRPI